MNDQLPDGWIPYLRDRTRFSNRVPIVSIQGKGSLNVNGPARAFLGDNVQLLYNPEKKQLGIRPVKADSKGALPIRHQKNSSQTFIISALGLFAAFDIDPKEMKGRYTPNEENGMLVLQLPTNGG